MRILLALLLFANLAYAQEKPPEEPKPSPYIYMESVDDGVWLQHCYVDKENHVDKECYEEIHQQYFELKKQKKKLKECIDFLKNF